MPVLPSSYLAPSWLRHPHAQTILRALLPAPRLPPPALEMLELPDGDFLEMAWHLAHDPSAPLAVLCHGLEGRAGSGYMLAMTRALQRTGCNTLAWSYRGCGRQPNRLPRSYHAGATEDLAAVLRRALDSATGDVLLVGFSLGGNLILKYLAENAPPARVRAGAAISAPVDLASSVEILDQQPANALYRLRFLRTLRRKASTKARRFPQQTPVMNGKNLRGVRAFDEAFTAPLHGFRDAADYYARSSALPLLPRLSVPVLLLNAKDDPLLDTPPSLAALAAASPFLHLETPDQGGHVAFLDRRHPLRSWWEQRVPEFFARLLDWDSFPREDRLTSAPQLHPPPSP